MARITKKQVLSLCKKVDKEMQDLNCGGWVI